MNSLSQYIIRRFAKYGSFLISPFERKPMRQYASLMRERDVIFIVGAPRTGSTLLFQMLTETLDVLYFDNLIEMFFKNMYFGFWLSDRTYQCEPHHCFTSKMGRTLECGLRGPSECGAFWYRWLAKEIHYVPRGQIDRKTVEEIRQNIDSVVNKYNRPLVIKNLNMGQRMGLISEFAPDAKFIFIKRDPLYAAQSIWQCKKSLGLQPSQWWSVKPKNVESLLQLDSYEMIVKQIFYLEAQIVKDSELFPKENFIAIQYKDLLHQPNETLDKLHAFIGHHVSKRENAILPHIQYYEEQKIPDEDFHRLKKEIERLDWKHYEQ